jgi:hypothetical protein
MRNSLLLFLLVFGILLTGLSAGTKQEYHSATVVSVANHETQSNYVGDNLSDAPLQSQVYSYDIGIRLNCTLYVVRYDSATDYLPSVFAPNRAVNVDLHKHDMYVNFPGDRWVRLGIDSRLQEKDKDCTTN